MYEKILYYIKNTVIDCWFFKWVGAGFSAVMVNFASEQMILFIFTILVGRSFLMIVGIIAGSKTEGFKLEKIGDGVFRLMGYYMMLFLGYMMAMSRDIGDITKIFYFGICIDITKRFVTHAKTLNIAVGDGFLSFIKKAEGRLANSALNKIGLTEDLDEKPVETTEKPL